MQTQVQNELIENSIETGKLFGMLKYLPDGQLTHAPFSLSPYSISAEDLHEMTELTSYFSELMIRVSQDWDFLDQHLGPSRSEEHTSELQSRRNLVCRLLLEKKNLPQVPH